MSDAIVITPCWTSLTWGAVAFPVVSPPPPPPHPATAGVAAATTRAARTSLRYLMTPSSYARRRLDGAPSVAPPDWRGAAKLPSLGRVRSSVVLRPGRPRQGAPDRRGGTA